MNIEIQGFHGTSFDNAKDITHNGFKLTKGDEEWLGDGVYFFVKGINDSPLKQAEEWAIAQAWDNVKKEYRFNRISVIKSNISVNKDCFLDLTTSDGVEILNYIIESHFTKIKSIGKRFAYVDGIVINFARNEKIIPIDVVKGNFYIKFTQERISQINRRIANCTICSVYLPIKILNGTTIVKTTNII